MALDRRARIVPLVEKHVADVLERQADATQREDPVEPGHVVVAVQPAARAGALGRRVWLRGRARVWLRWRG
jgi:hypothetical protein